MKVYQRIAGSISALLNCQKQDDISRYQKAIDGHETTLEYIEKYILPHGSGIDGDSEIDWYNSKSDKFVIHSSYHVMTDGYYDGWIDYTVNVKPSWYDIDMHITGKFGKNQDEKEYLYQVYNQILTENLNELDMCSMKNFFQDAA